MKKQYDTSRIVNELEDSLFFQKSGATVVGSEDEKREMPASQHVVMPSGRHDDKPASQHAGIANLADEGVLTEKETFRCTRLEVIAINRLKDSLYDRWDLRTSKQNLERYAIEIVMKDYEARGEHSDIVRLLRSKSEKR